MTSFIAFCIGLVAAGFVRHFLGAKHTDKLSMIHSSLAAIVFLVWIIDGHHRLPILLVALGLLFAVFINVLPNAFKKLNRLQTIAFSAWMLMLGSFVVKALVVE